MLPRGSRCFESEVEGVGGWGGRPLGRHRYIALVSLVDELWRSGGGLDCSPRSGKSVGSSGRWFVLVLLSEVQPWLACNIKDLKIWKQALRKGTAENSSSEYGKCRAKGSSLEQRFGCFPEPVG